MNEKTNLIKTKERVSPYYVIIWDVNRDTIENYDIMPYICECYDDLENKPKTFDEFKTFILKECKYRFWSRCEYEIIVTGWPISNRNEKIDVYDQIEQNIDTITKKFMSELGIYRNELVGEFCDYVSKEFYTTKDNEHYRYPNRIESASFFTVEELIEDIIDKF